MLLIIGLSLLATGLGLAQPYLTKFLIDDGLLAGRFDVLVFFCGLMVLAGLVASLLGALNRWQYVDVSARILHALREALFTHLLKLPPTYYARTRGGDTLARLDGDIAEIQRFAVDPLLAGVNGVLALTGALLLMFTLSPLLTLLALVLLPAQLGFLRWLRPRIEDLSRRLRERASDITAFFFERLAAVKTVQAAAAEQRESDHLHRLNDAFRRTTLRLQMTHYAATTVPGFLTSLSTALVFIIGGWLTIRGELTVGTLIAFSAYLARSTGPVQTLLGLYVAWQRARVSLRRVREIADLEPAVQSPARPVVLPSTARGELRLDHVGFAYEAVEILRDVDVTVAAGSKTGLIGVSGVGKSTLIDLLLRHYDPDRGRILLDGIDLRELELSELRGRIAVVSQDTVLFAGSLLDNLRYVRPEADQATIRSAALRAQVEEFAERLPQGYDSDIGPRGTGLSGGQRQRIAIARALLQDPLVLILDEATSGLDLDTERRVIAAVDELFGDRTRLIISHRPQTLTGADRVLELRDGVLRPLEAAS